MENIARNPLKPLTRLDVRSKSVDGATVIGTASTRILQANGKRTYALLVNDSDTVIYLGKGRPAVLNVGVRLNAAGGAYEISLVNPYYGAIYGIAGAITKNLTWNEQE